MRIVTRFLCVVGAVLCLSSVSEARNIKGVFNLGIDFGGDDLATVYYVGGDTSDVKAGELLSFSGGLMYSAQKVDTMLTIGYKFDSATASNGDIKYSRYPVDLLALYKIKKFRLGGGLTYHINPTLKGDGYAANINVALDDALGFLIQTDFIIIPSLTVGLRYTIIDYDVSNSNDSVDGNSFGLIFGAIF